MEKSAKPELTVMLTYQDRTVPNAWDIFESCKNTAARFWGFKEEPLPLSEMKALYDYMKTCGKTTALEVVAYTEAECVKGAETAAFCGVDYLMGTMFFDSVLDICRQNNIRYYPFVGRIHDRPSILEGTPEEMIEEALTCLEKGADGIDLLGYRYTGDATALCRRFVHEVPAPVCLAGSINSLKRLDEVKEIGPASFTIGSAFFNHCFGEDIAAQIDYVVQYLGSGPQNIS